MCLSHFSLRLQAYICLKLYSIKKSEVQRLRKAIEENVQVIWCYFALMCMYTCH